MIGTCNEILLYLTRNSEVAPLFQVSRQRLVGLRKHLYGNEIAEATKEKMLIDLKNRIAGLRSDEKFMSKSIDKKFLLIDIRKIRNRYVLPAVVRDKHGKYFQETTFIRMVCNEKKMEDLNLGKVCASMKYGCLPLETTVREALRRKGWTMFEPRQELPSVWEVTY